MNSKFVIVLLALLFDAASTVTVADCPAGLPRDQYLQVYNGLCYQFAVFRLRLYGEAVRECGLHGGTLVVIPDRETNNFLQQSFVNYHSKTEAWIGLTDTNKEGRFDWPDGSTANFTNFAALEGHHFLGLNSNEDCVTIDPKQGGHWKDHECGVLWLSTNQRPYVCQYMPTVEVSQVPSVSATATLTTIPTTIANATLTTIPTTTATVTLTTIPTTTATATLTTIPTTAATANVQSSTTTDNSTSIGLPANTTASSGVGP